MRARFRKQVCKVLAIESTGAFANGGKIGYPEADNSLATGNSVGANGTSVPTQNAPSSVTGLVV